MTRDKWIILGAALLLIGSMVITGRNVQRVLNEVITEHAKQDTVLCQAEFREAKTSADTLTALRRNSKCGLFLPSHR